MQNLFGKNLKKLRESNKMPVKVLAEFYNVDAKTYKSFETKPETIKLEYVIKSCELYGIKSVDTLLKEDILGEKVDKNQMIECWVRAKAVLITRRLGECGCFASEFYGDIVKDMAAQKELGNPTFWPRELMINETIATTFEENKNKYNVDKKKLYSAILSLTLFSKEEVEKRYRNIIPIKKIHKRMEKIFTDLQEEYITFFKNVNNHPNIEI